MNSIARKTGLSRLLFLCLAAGYLLGRVRVCCVVAVFLKHHSSSLLRMHRSIPTCVLRPAIMLRYACNAWLHIIAAVPLYVRLAG